MALKYHSGLKLKTQKLFSCYQGLFASSILVWISLVFQYAIRTIEIIEVKVVVRAYGLCFHCATRRVNVLLWRCFRNDLWFTRLWSLLPYDLDIFTKIKSVPSDFLWYLWLLSFVWSLVPCKKRVIREQKTIQLASVHSKLPDYTSRPTQLDLSRLKHLTKSRIT